MDKLFMSRQIAKSMLGDFARQYCRTFGDLERIEEKDGLRSEYYRMADGSIYLIVRALGGSDANR